jgi:Na+-transporting methylmalonyl-CoA/oxaloacetate decarboxylase gamma subunit
MGAQLAVNAGNPYAPELLLELLPERNSESDVRRLERARGLIRVVGILFYLRAIAAAVSALACIAIAIYFFRFDIELRTRGMTFTPLDFAMVSIYWISWCALLVSVASGVRRFDRRSAVWARVISGLTLLLIPVGTVFGLLCLLVLATTSARKLFNTQGTIDPAVRRTSSEAHRSGLNEHSSMKPIIAVLVLGMAMLVLSAFAMG